MKVSSVSSFWEFYQKRDAGGLGILHHAKSFLSKHELLATYKALVCSLMKYCTPLWAGAPASHLSWLYAVETKAFRIIGISHVEAESLRLSLSAQASRWSFCLLSGLTLHALSVICPPPIFHRVLKVCQQPPSGKTTKINKH